MKRFDDGTDAKGRSDRDARKRNKRDHKAERKAKQAARGEFVGKRAERAKQF